SPRHTPKTRLCLKDALFYNLKVGQFCEHSVQWVRWVNLVSTQRGGAASESMVGQFWGASKSEAAHCSGT
ncbi:MAG: hypothetical protein WBG50_16435, partial [Desulfomonilaceae bacterium]